MPRSSRVPPAVGALPLVGDLVKQAEGQAQWMQEMLEQNSRLVGQLPATMKSFNASLERFNQTVARLDRVVSRVERTTDQLVAPMEQLAQRLERLSKVLGELPGAAILRRLAGGTDDPPSG